MPSAIAPGSISASRSDAKPSAKPHTMTRGVLATSSLRRLARDLRDRCAASLSTSSLARDAREREGGEKSRARDDDAEIASAQRGARERAAFVPRYRRDGEQKARANDSGRGASATRARGRYEGASEGFAYGGERVDRRLSTELNGEITSARTGEEILEHVRVRSHLYNRVNCATAWHRLAKKARQRLLPRAWEAGSDARVMDLEATTKRLLATFQIQNLSNFAWSCAVLKYKPRDDLLGLVADRMEQKVDEFYPQALTNTLWAYTVLKHPRAQRLAEILAPVILSKLPEPDKELMQAESATGGEFSTQTVSNALWTLSSLGVHPGYELLDRLAIFVVKSSQNFKAQELSNSVWAFAQFAHHPGNEALRTFERSILERREEYTTQALANTTIGLSVFGGSEDDGLNKLFNDVTPSWFRLSECNSQDLSNITWAIASVGAFQSDLYKAAVRELFRRDSMDFQLEGLKMLFHARLMQHDFDPERETVDVVYPDWVAELGRSAWLQQTEDTRVSTFQKEVLETVKSLGHEPYMEELTDDGLLSMDICLKDKRVAIECDGPSHFYTNLTEGLTQKTKLRDKALAVRGWKVVTVPYFEWQVEWGAGAVSAKSYIEKKLQAVGA